MPWIVLSSEVRNGINLAMFEPTASYSSLSCDQAERLKHPAQLHCGALGEIAWKPEMDDDVR